MVFMCASGAGPKVLTGKNWAWLNSGWQPQAQLGDGKPPITSAENFEMPAKLDASLQR